MAELKFSKTGREIKAAIENRRAQLRARLDKRNRDLDAFMQDQRKVRSYMVRNTLVEYAGMHRGGQYALVSSDDASSEERREIQQLCRRIFEIEQELYQLALVSSHLKDDQLVDLTLQELVAYGFEPGMETE